jgi:hypothetical protein
MLCLSTHSPFVLVLFCRARRALSNYMLDLVRTNLIREGIIFIGQLFPYFAAKNFPANSFFCRYFLISQLFTFFPSYLLFLPLFPYFAAIYFFFLAISFNLRYFTIFCRNYKFSLFTDYKAQISVY